MKLNYIPTSGHTVCTGQAVEMATVGGEESFLMAIVIDSLVLRERVGWYTCMMGRKRTLKILLKILRCLGVRNPRSTKFVQGKTMRWGLAWTFLPIAKQSISCADKVFAKIPTVVTAQGLEETELTVPLQIEISSNQLLDTCLPKERLVKDITSGDATSTNKISLLNVLRDRIETAIRNNSGHADMANRIELLTAKPSDPSSDSCSTDVTVWIGKVTGQSITFQIKITVIYEETQVGSDASIVALENTSSSFRLIISAFDGTAPKTTISEKDESSGNICLNEATVAVSEDVTIMPWSHIKGEILKVLECIKADIMRNNRRWRRLLKSFGF